MMYIFLSNKHNNLTFMSLSLKNTFITDKFPSNEANFYDVLNTYIATAGTRFKRDLVFTDDSKTALEVKLFFLFSYCTLNNRSSTVYHNFLALRYISGY